MKTVKTSIDLSMSESRTVCGYEIKKMPLGAYLKAVKILQDAPEALMNAMYPGEGVEGFWAHMRTMDKAGLQSLILRAMAVVPGKVFELFAQLSGIAESKLTNDPAIGLDGLMAMMLAWLEVNGIENFMAGAQELIAKLRAQRTGSGGSSD